MPPDNKEITVLIDTTPEWTEIKLNLDDIASYGGMILASTPDRVNTHLLSVSPEYRGQGFGEALVRKLAETAIELGAKKLVGHMESQYALDIRARVFGKQAMRFYADTDPADIEVSEDAYEELPISFDQARRSLVRAEGYEDDLEVRNIGFHVEVDLSDK